MLWHCRRVDVVHGRPLPPHVHREAQPGKSAHITWPRPAICEACTGLVVRYRLRSALLPLWLLGVRPAKRLERPAVSAPPFDRQAIAQAGERGVLGLIVARGGSRRDKNGKPLS